MGKPTELLQGTLDLLILKTLALEPMHGWGITLRIQQITGEVLQVRPGALYPALHRLEHQGWIVAKWGETAAGRRAKYYSLTRAGSSAARARGRRSGVGCRRRSRHSSIPSDRSCSSASTIASLMALRSFLRRRTVDQELDEELRFHLEQMQELAASRGDDPVRRTVAGATPHGQRGSREGGLSRHAHAATGRTFPARSALWSPPARPRTRLHHRRGPLAGAWHRREQRDLFAHQRRSCCVHCRSPTPQELYIAQATEPDEVELLFSYPVVARAATLLAGRAEIAAQSSTESVLIATRGDGVERVHPSRRGCNWSRATIFGTLRQRAQIGRLLGPDDNRTARPASRRGDQRSVLEPPVRPSARVLDTELIINGAPMAIVGVAAPEFFGTTVDTRDAGRLGASSDAGSPPLSPADYDRTGGDLQKPWPSQPEIAWLQVMIRVPAGGAPAAAEAMTLARAPRESTRRRQDAGRGARHPASGIGWLLADAARVDHAAHRAAADGRPAARDRVRQYRQSAARARDEPQSRDGDSSVHGSGTRTADPTAAHREPAARLASAACWDWRLRIGAARRC